MTPSGIEPATFRFVAQHLKHRATAVPRMLYLRDKMNSCSSYSKKHFHVLGSKKYDYEACIILITISKFVPIPPPKKSEEKLVPS